MEDPAMHDIAIRGGTIVDGTGAPAFTGDVAVEGGRIAAVGGKAGPARRVIDAHGLLVTPGWGSMSTPITTARRPGTRSWRRPPGMA
jgi:N-acyl-D-amino-acid deacylase